MMIHANEIDYIESSILRDSFSIIMKVLSFRMCWQGPREDTAMSWKK